MYSNNEPGAVGKIRIISIEKVDDLNVSTVNCLLSEYDDATSTEVQKTIWFSVDKQWSKGLCSDLSDAYIIGILSYCMRKRYDIYSDVPMTNVLKHNLVEYLMPLICKADMTLRQPNLFVDTVSEETIRKGDAIGTGASCGLDSMHAIWHYYNHEKEFKLTHLCINNVGAFGCYSDSEKSKDLAYTRSEQFSRDLHLPLIRTNSNIHEVIKQSHYLTNTYTTLFAVYMLRYHWKKYYIGSCGGLLPTGFTLNENASEDSSHYEIISFPALSTNNLKIIGEGEDCTRFEKLKDISDFHIAKKYLYSCHREETNCGKCLKCMANLLCIDALGELNQYRQSYDIDYYKKNRKMYLMWLIENKVELGQAWMEDTKAVFLSKKDVDYLDCLKSEKLIKNAVKDFNNKSNPDSAFAVFNKYMIISSRAAKYYALCLLTGFGCEIDKSGCLDVLKRLFNEKALPGALILTYIDLLIESNDSADVEEALTLLNHYAYKKKGPGALFKLGTMLIEGNILEENKEEGIRLIRKSAKLGYGPALSYLTTFHIED